MLREWARFFREWARAFAWGNSITHRFVKLATYLVAAVGLPKAFDQPVYISLGLPEWRWVGRWEQWTLGWVLLVLFGVICVLWAGGVAWVRSRGAEFSLGPIQEDVYWNAVRLPVKNSGNSQMEPPDVEVVCVKDHLGTSIGVFPVPFPLWRQHQQSLPRRPIQPGNQEIFDLIHRREDGSVTFTHDIPTAAGNIAWIPIPITEGNVFFCVRLTAPQARTKNQWFSISRDPAAALMVRVVSVSPSLIPGN
jgi:hypothetical protein